MDQAFAMVEQPYSDTMMDNRCAILVLAGAFSDALKLLEARLDQFPQDNYLRFTQAPCLLHLERYDDAITTYEQVITKERYYYDDEGLKAARCRQQPDWDNL
jgi:tetratricopeptide (TPR) repeat protein